MLKFSVYITFKVPHCLFGTLEDRYTKYSITINPLRKSHINSLRKIQKAALTHSVSVKIDYKNRIV